MKTRKQEILPGARTVQPLADYRLLITFDNGERRLFDVGPYLETGVFRELRDVKVFKSVRISFDTVQWQNGADICPETLYQDSLPAGDEPLS